MIADDENFIVSEVGAYEAIHSDRERDHHQHHHHQQQQQQQQQQHLSTSNFMSHPPQLHQQQQYHNHQLLSDSSLPADDIDCHQRVSQLPLEFVVTVSDGDAAGGGCGIAGDDHHQLDIVSDDMAIKHVAASVAEAAELRPPRTIKCPQCRRYFANNDELYAHSQVRHSAEMNERFKCSVCGQAFSSQGSLYKHQKIHTGERPFVCETCHKTFNQLANLQRHFMVHTGEKPFACKTCGKQFSQQSNVDKHQVTHSKIKPFSCNICKKQFTQRANLQKHERVHTGERPFVCPICHKCYTQHANMKKHVLTHNKSNYAMAYMCAKCKDMFDTVLLYEAHLDFCEGEKQDFNFQLVSGELDDLVAASGVVGDMAASAASLQHDPSGEQHPAAVAEECGDFANRINIMNVIKTEVTDGDGFDHQLLFGGSGDVVVANTDEGDDDPMLMQHVEYLDE